MADAIVAGAGPNGLVAANVLADAGWQVEVLEAQEEPGGAVRSDRGVDPAFISDLFCSFHHLAAASPAMRALELERFGLRWSHAPVVLAHPMRDGRCVVLRRGQQETVAGMEQDAGAADAEAWAAAGRVRAARGPTARIARQFGLRSASLAALGLEKSRIERLGLPDGGLSVRPGELADAVRRLIAGTEADVCVAPRSFDMRPDHESVGRAAVAVGAQLGVPVWQYPVWMWHRALPGDPRVRWQRASRIDLPAETVALKNRAIDCHESQIAPLGPGPEDAAILAAGDLEHFRRDFEVVLT
ncbi:FAD-dependent oxidoreductase [Actinospica robiniae]|uniref:FAD-dependent oxidoreductase n=1 Tax=Actinospica robiniae TaxID=304901 RepID=UPI000686C88B|nr:FAD-dependent oxidoreductase [Actinospica robiniae]